MCFPAIAFEIAVAFLKPSKSYFVACIMALFRLFLCDYRLLYFFLQLIQVVQGKGTDRGSLVTYRQYTNLLNQAPQCYRNGYGAENESLTTISSSGSRQAPCYNLSTIISDHFQADWCMLCRQREVACRIKGWPILNSTSMCQFVPNHWLFYTDGGCCISGTEPFEVARWIGNICNGKWRDPFMVYGGMAREDWEE